MKPKKAQRLTPNVLAVKNKTIRTLRRELKQKEECIGVLFSATSRLRLLLARNGDMHHCYIFVDRERGTDRRLGLTPYKYPFKTVGAALDAAAPGDLVWDGTTEYDPIKIKLTGTQK